MASRRIAHQGSQSTGFPYRKDRGGALVARIVWEPARADPIKRGIFRNFEKSGGIADVDLQNSLSSEAPPLLASDRGSRKVQHGGGFVRPKQQHI